MNKFLAVFDILQLHISQYGIQNMFSSPEMMVHEFSDHILTICLLTFHISEIFKKFVSANSFFLNDAQNVG